MPQLNYSVEARISQGPWTSLVKGRSLGALSRKFDPIIAEHVKGTFKALSRRVSDDNHYLCFSSRLTSFVLDLCDPEHLLFRRKELLPRVDQVLHTLSAIGPLSTRVHASSVLLECFGKSLDLTTTCWLTSKWMW